MTVDGAFTLRAPGAGTLTAGQVPAGYTVTTTPYGTRVEGPGGESLLYACPEAPADPPTTAGGHAPVPPPQQVDLALVDVVESPRSVGALRRAGVVGTTTAVAALGGDHRLHSPAEFERRARLWGTFAPSDGQELPCPPAAWPPSRIRGPHRALVTGGARSGKSAEAERRLLAEPEVTYIATGPTADGDDAWRERVEAHRARRPWWWRTEETLDVAAVLRRASGAVLLDCVGTWLAGVLDACGMWDEQPPVGAEEELRARIDELVEAWRRCGAYAIAVTNEVGSGVVPPTASGGMFRDYLGRVNQRLAAESEDVVLTAVGRISELP
ncbi:bifunctional adenosylcobinamide kinase/adenosylcobinamide-phosphate guanylyltransferase [Haloactinospora alba]|uniref:bifunctional adenosylcobinamide kinase/adenosylcobinamide-phosphate guanylyltransferase n=1 Tax=Haloactinospora alba TaxID=405555 RepID=UPI00114D5A2F|nr:bifunctional adenosylcobinamide kinase/adenosylcobinamide-phosphate guanylyltransferase [Haloactinospora alba]